MVRGEDDMKGGEHDPVTQQSDRSTGRFAVGPSQMPKLVKGSRKIDFVIQCFQDFGSVASIVLPRAQEIRRVGETSVSAPACRVRFGQCFCLITWKFDSRVAQLGTCSAKGPGGSLLRGDCFDCET